MQTAVGAIHRRFAVRTARSCQSPTIGSRFHRQVQDMSFLALDLLRDGARELGVELTGEQLDLLDRFAMQLIETNKTLNLTRIREPDEIVTGHYLDSFTCLAAADIRPNSRVIDIGTGAGFPGVPIKVARPDLDVTLLDSSRKKLGFIEEAAAELGIEDIALVHSRAEDAGRDPNHRGRYDVAFARALADMTILAELGLPLVKVGGMLIAQKSEAADKEIEAAKPVIGQLGGRIDRISRIRIPGTEIVRSLVVIGKKKPSPPVFPRAYAEIARKRRQR